MAFFGLDSLFGKNDPQKTMGINLTSNNKPLSHEIDDIGNRFMKNNRKTKQELTKYKQVAELNKKLSYSYRQNLIVMVDISKLLNSYAAFFDLLRNELEKNERELPGFELRDVEHIESMTRDKMQQFTQSFLQQSEKIKNLYRKYGQNDEAARIANLETSLGDINRDAETALRFIRAPNVSGGGKKKVSKK